MEFFGKRVQFNRRSTAVVGLLALVLLQVSLAAHQFDHSVSEASEACALCVQLDRSGDAPTASVEALDFATDGAPAVSLPTWTVEIAPTFSLHIRGPPNA